MAPDFRGHIMRKSVLFVAILLAGTIGCSRKTNDATIENTIKSNLYSDPAVKSANINVTVKNGEVTLSGEATDPRVQIRIYEIARSAPGVRQVNNQMPTLPQQTATPPAPAPESAKSFAPQPSADRPPVTAPAEAPKDNPPPPASVAQAPVQPPSPTEAPSPPAPPPPPKKVEPQPVKVTIPEGTQFGIRMIDAIDSQKNHTGEMFRASLDAPVLVDGDEVAPAGSDVFVRLAEAKSAGRMTGKSELELQLA